MHLTALSATFVSSLTLTAIASSQDIDITVPCADGPDPVILCYGEHAACGINFQGDEDQFHFFGVLGDSVTIRVVTQTNSLDPILTLFSATLGAIDLSGTVHQCASNLHCSFATELTLPASGAYAIFLRDDDNANTGSYTIHLEKGLPDYPVPALVYGGSPELIAMGHVGDYDWLRVDGGIGTDIRVVLVSQTNSLDIQAALYAPDGVVLQSGGCASNLHCTTVLDVINLPVDGPYWLRIWDDDGFNGGSMLVSLSCQSPFVMCPSGTTDGPLGTTYCVANMNSTSGMAILSAFGSANITDNRLYLTASTVPDGSFGIFFTGMNQAAGTSLPAPSLGLLCVNNPFWRQRVVQTCANEETHYRLPLDALPGGMTILPGETWNFQLWFRDGSSSNTSNGIEIQFF